MTGSSYASRRSEALALVFLLAAPFALAAPCKRPPGGQAAETNIIYVQFKGCALKDPPTIRIGVEPLILKKIAHEELGDVWRATTRGSFPVTQPPQLQIDTPANVRAACTVVPTDLDASGCVMVYPILCESVWVLNVHASTKPKIDYARRPAQHTVQACDPPPTPRGLGDVELTLSEGVEMKFLVPKNQVIPVPLSLRSFGVRKTFLTVDDLNLKCPDGQNPSESTDACIALMKAKIDKVATALRLTKNLP